MIISLVSLILLNKDEILGTVGYMNHGWKLILLGLVQAEPMARYLAMLSIQKALSTLKKTLFEMETLSVRILFFKFYRKLFML